MMGDYRNLFMYDDVPVLVGDGRGNVVGAYDAVKHEFRLVPSRHRRFVLYSESLGVYLGSFMGLGFWSKLDPAGQPGAVTLPSEEEASAFVATWEGHEPPADLRAVAVLVVAPDRATIAECVAAGLPAWDPEAALS
jgi:hypothetical protein